MNMSTHISGFYRISSVHNEAISLSTPILQVRGTKLPLNPGTVDLVALNNLVSNSDPARYCGGYIGCRYSAWRDFVCILRHVIMLYTLKTSG